MNLPLGLTGGVRVGGIQGRRGSGHSDTICAVAGNLLKELLLVLGVVTLQTR